MKNFLLLILLWSLWCFLHSAMISLTVTGWLKNMLGDSYRYYRLFFNVVALVTLIPVMIYGSSLGGPEIFRWRGLWRLPQILLGFSAVYLFIAGARFYDGLQLLGIREITEHESRRGLNESGGLEFRGILGVVRHPWYAGGILIIWARDINAAVLLTNLVLTAYLIIGTRLEERKLVVEFGDRYRQYQREVSMLLPVKWLKSRWKGSGSRSE